MTTDEKKFIDALNQLCEENPYQKLTGDITNGYHYHSTNAPASYENYYVKRKNERKQTMRKPIKIKKVVFNNPATIVMWSDGTKTVVKCSERDTYDPEKGLAMAVAKKSFGNKGNYYKELKYWLPEESEKQDIVTITTSSFEGLKEEILKAFSEVK